MIKIVNSFRENLKTADFLSSLRITLRNSLGAVRISENGLLMEVDSSYQVSRLKEKEPETVEWIQGQMNRGDIFYDVGACVGSYSLLAAKKGLIVYSFEPAFRNYASFCRNIILNGLTKNIISFQVALGKSASMRGTEVSNFKAGAANLKIRDLGSGISVTTFGLDEFVKLFNLPQPKFIKIDTDGYEDEVIKGAETTLKNAKSILVEVDERESASKEVINFFLANDFELSNRVQRHTKPVYNYIFNKRLI